MTPQAERLAARWWPGPLTIVVRARPILARETLGGGATVGIRIPDHAVATALARDAGFCVTATSANRSGATAASTPGRWRSSRRCPTSTRSWTPGPSRGGAPSTIVDASARDVTLVRQGAVPWERVLKSLK